MKNKLVNPVSFSPNLCYNQKKNIRASGGKVKKLIKRSFKGGVHPLSRTHEGKALTRNEKVREFIPETVCIPMNLHLGAPSKPCVKKGDKVLMGQLIGEPIGFLGLPVHASVSGEVIDVSEKQQLGANKVTCITIKNDFRDTACEPFENIGSCESAEPRRIVERIKEAGICGMGGAAFPPHIKLTIPDDKYADIIILNGAECETHLTSDFRLMLENPEPIVDGLRAVMRAMNCKEGVIAIEDNKPEAIEKMKEVCSGREGVSVRVLKTKYPQGSEKQLITAVTGREVMRGKLPIDSHVIVMNVATSAAIARAVNEGKPLISRITTVTGKVKNPSNLLLRVGTIAADAIDFCGGYSTESIGKLIAGGMMTGPAAPDDSFSVTKAMGGLVALSESEAFSYEEQPCIRCARCVAACPVGLNPAMIKRYCEANDMEGAKRNNVLDCILCGCCSYTCPANRFLTASFKSMKERIAFASKLNGGK